MNRSLKTPVGAHYGTGDWLVQRLTAVVMAVYTLVFAGCVLYRPPGNWVEWRGLFSGTFFRLFTMLFIIALLYHAWVGVRDILMDYIRATGIRLAAQAVVGATLLFYLIWSASILWGR